MNISIRAKTMLPAMMGSASPRPVLNIRLGFDLTPQPGAPPDDPPKTQDQPSKCFSPTECTDPLDKQFVKDLRSDCSCEERFGNDLGTHCDICYKGDIGTDCDKRYTGDIGTDYDKRYTGDIGTDCDQCCKNDLGSGCDKRYTDDPVSHCDQRYNNGLAGGSDTFRTNPLEDGCQERGTEAVTVVVEGNTALSCCSRRDVGQVVSLRASPSLVYRSLHVVEEARRNKGAHQKCHELRMGIIQQQQKPSSYFWLRREMGGITLQSETCRSYIAVNSCSEHDDLTLMSPSIQSDADRRLFHFEIQGTENIVMIKSAFCPSQYVTYADCDPSKVYLSPDGSMFELFKEGETTDDKIRGLDVVDGLSTMDCSGVVFDALSLR